MHTCMLQSSWSAATRARESNLKGCGRSRYNQLPPQQRKAVICEPTYGEWKIAIMLLTAAKDFRLLARREVTQSVAVIVSPLIALMKDQARAVTQRNVSAVYAGWKRSGVTFAVRSNRANAVKTFGNGCQLRDDIPFAVEPYRFRRCSGEQQVAQRVDGITTITTRNYRRVTGYVIPLAHQTLFPSRRVWPARLLQTTEKAGPAPKVRPVRP